MIGGKRVFIKISDLISNQKDVKPFKSGIQKDEEKLKNHCPCGTQQLCPEDGCSAYKEYKAKLLTLTEREKNILFSPFRDDWC